MSTVKTVMMLAVIFTIAGALLHAGVADPSPRIVYVGEELIQQPNYSGEPARAFFYKDAATSNEIVCFAGQLRETLSCLQTGRTR